jgi:hypothetical protein
MSLVKKCSRVEVWFNRNQSFGVKVKSGYNFEEKLFVILCWLEVTDECFKFSIYCVRRVPGF